MYYINWTATKWYSWKKWKEIRWTILLKPLNDIPNFKSFPSRLKTKIISHLLWLHKNYFYYETEIITSSQQRPTKGVTYCHSFCSRFAACFIVINVTVSFDPWHKLQFVAFSQSEPVLCGSFLDSLSPLFKECRLSVITRPWWAS